MAQRYAATPIREGTWRISGGSSDAYLLEGADKAIMIDAGFHAPDVADFLRTVTDKPILGAIDTHSHFDHTSGNGYFDKVYATEGIARSAKNTMGGDPAKFPLDYAFTIVGDGDVIDLGGRPLTIIEMDSHSPGNVAILDEARGLLFPGDEIETGQVLLLPGYAEEPGQLHARPASTVEAYLRALEKVNAFRDKFDTLCPAHNGSPIGAEWVDKYIALAKRVLAGEEGSADCSGRGYNDGMGHFPRGEANYRRAEWDGASLIYCADRVRDPGGEQVAPATELHRMSANSIYS